ncbi:hypothetical protein POJ06DRAFT_273806 [Lipomyces tetrasporus]|uniref:KOW domain-containing protein n=1 Tax=Lipomyces tetrasporus TaxID=54092 RepID=A0AAD7QXE2_9ASCO|nr:uncharacterized protein POJ06DRAFT_273806 [Lipomyces tetrasporus]KAJ8103234.1 hypothetical protein POJ06DRAFT_273806 [Lipomyces tetrasporus]
MATRLRAIVPRYSAYMRHRRAMEIREAIDAKKTVNERPRVSEATPSFMTGQHVEGPVVRDFLYMVGDLVQVTKPGPDYGKISRITSIHKERSAVSLEQVGPIQTSIVPRVYWSEQHSKYVARYPGLIHHDDVRLVTTLADTEDEFRKVAVNGLTLGELYYDDRYKTRLRRRYVVNAPGIAIPWPDPAEDVRQGNFATDHDVARERTFFVTSLAVPPVPPAALDSLRNKYARHRKPDLTEDEIQRLTPPEMPLSAAKIAFRSELQEMKEKKKQAIESGELAATRLKTAQFLKMKISQHQQQQKALKKKKEEGDASE